MTNEITNARTKKNCNRGTAFGQSVEKLLGVGRLKPILFTLNSDAALSYKYIGALYLKTHYHKHYDEKANGQLRSEARTQENHKQDNDWSDSSQPGFLRKILL